MDLHRSAARGLEILLERLRGGALFVPPIPRLKVTEVAEVVAPGCRQEVIGIRPGEKLHEIMITPDDALHTAEYDRHFVLQPATSWWDRDRFLRETGGRAVAEDFQYSSDRNGDWLSREGLAEILKHEKIEL